MTEIKENYLYTLINNPGTSNDTKLCVSVQDLRELAEAVECVTRAKHCTV